MQDEYYMNIALQLAKSVEGQTTPNPPVGAVIVKDGVIIGMGAHLKSGEAHAEVIALQMAGEKAKDATIYVTLEPCSHTGKTPPCADAIITKQLKRVVIASIDQHEQVAGRGIKKLRKAGIEVEQGILADETNALYTMFFHYIKNKTPYVTLKTAMTLDGKIATVDGESQWITGDKAREDVHIYRHLHDAILVGIGTVLTDNPKLTTRLPHGKNPIRVILDTHLRTPLDAHIITDEEAPTWIFVGNQVSNEKIQLYEAYEQVRIMPMSEQEINIKNVLQCLGKNQITSVFVEGGALINGAFLKAEYINQFIVYIAPKVFGGEHAKTSIAGDGIAKIKDALALQISTIEMIGDDIKLIARKGEQ